MISASQYLAIAAENTEPARLDRRITSILSDHARYVRSGYIEVSVGGWSERAVDAMRVAYEEQGWTVRLVTDAQALRYVAGPALVFSCEVAA